jgi:ribonucleoside-diphosphate reductase beta chain
MSGSKLLDPGFELTLRPMKYPKFYEMYKAARKNNWTPEEVDFSTDITDMKSNMTPAEVHLVKRLLAFFATGDTVVANNLVINLYQHINSPEARMFLLNQGLEESNHIDFYLLALDSLLFSPKEREEAFAAIENIPSIAKKAEFCLKWLDSISGLKRLETREHRKQFLLNLICFAACIEGLFFFGAFAYVYYLRSRGLLNGLASGTNWVFRDESGGHMEFAFEVIRTVREEEPDLFDADLKEKVVEMMKEAVACETQFAQDVVGGGVMGLSLKDMRQYLEYVADQRLVRLDIGKHFHSTNPFDFMELQDVQELTNFFERRVSSYQVGVTGEVGEFNEDF